MIKSRKSILLAALCVAGCAPHGGMNTAVKPIPVSALPSQMALGSKTFPVIPADDIAWSHGDPQLAKLMAEAVAGSPSVAQAMARLRKAEALVGVQDSARGVQVTGDGSFAYAKLSENQGFPPQFIPKGLHSNSRLALSAVWDADLFGRNKEAIRAAVSDAQAAQYDVAQARLILVSSLALAYVDYARAYSDDQAYAALMETRARVVDLNATRVKAGLDNQSAVHQADQAYQQARALAAAAQAALKVARFRIAELVGAGPDRGLLLEAPQLHDEALDQQQWVGDSLAQRPDVAAALVRVDAAAKRIEVARRDFYPNLSLSALAGLQSLDFPQFLKYGSSIPSFGPAVHLPIFDGGRLKANYRGQQADYEAAVANYNATLIAALRDAATALARTQTSAQALEADVRATVDAQASAHIADTRLKAQLTSKIPALAAHETQLLAQLALDDARLQLIYSQMDALRAVGGVVPVRTAQGDPK